jgi:prophage regulatory protein
VPRKKPPPVGPRVILRRPEVERRTGYKNTTLWRKEKKGEFPRRISLDPNGMAVGWFEDEIDAWVCARIREAVKRPPGRRPRPPQPSE